MRKNRLIVCVLPFALLAALICVAPVGLTGFVLATDEISVARTLKPALRTAFVMIAGGGLCTVCALMIATYIFYFIPERWKSSVDTALFCFAGISPVVFAVLTVALWRGRLDGAALYFAIMLCLTARATRYISESFTLVSPALIDSARALGLTGFGSIRKVLIPTSMPGIIGTAFITMGAVGALPPVLNLIGSGQYLTGLLILGERGQGLAAVIHLALCAGFFAIGNYLTGRWKNV